MLKYFNDFITETATGQVYRGIPGVISDWYQIESDIYMGIESSKISIFVHTFWIKPAGTCITQHAAICIAQPNLHQVETSWRLIKERDLSKLNPSFTPHTGHYSRFGWILGRGIWTPDQVLRFANEINQIWTVYARSIGIGIPMNLSKTYKVQLRGNK